MSMYTLSVAGACNLLSFYDRARSGGVVYLTKRDELDYQVIIDNAFINQVNCDDDAMHSHYNAYVLTKCGKKAVEEALRTMNSFVRA